MAYQVGRSTPKRAKPSYIYSIISISLVLYMLGMLGLIVLYAQKLSDYFKENIEIVIILKDNIKEAEIHRLRKHMESELYIKSTEYVDKDEAASRLIEEYREDFIELLEYNPLFASININLQSKYANPDSLMWIEAGIMENQQVKEIYYDGLLVDLLNSNVKKYGLILSGISFILLIIALTLIDNTIRLAMYSNRFLIKSMQLVGATRWFIMRPFISISIVIGLIGSLLAVGILVATFYYASRYIPELISLQDYTRTGILLSSIVVLGVIMSWLSTQRATRKYLKMRLDDLY